jgi:hypothetical protein
VNRETGQEHAGEDRYSKAHEMKRYGNTSRGLAGGPDRLASRSPGVEH